MGQQGPIQEHLEEESLVEVAGGHRAMAWLVEWQKVVVDRAAMKNEKKQRAFCANEAMRASNQFDAQTACCGEVGHQMNTMINSDKMTG